MSTEPVTLTAPGGAPAALAGAKPKPRFDPRYIAPVMITLVLLGTESVGMLENRWYTGLAIVVSMVTELIIGRLMLGFWPHLSSAYVSGISVGILTRSGQAWPFALCAAISIVSKYVFRVKGRHIWNPSNFGIAVMLLLAPSAFSTLTIQFGNSFGPMAVIWCIGALIISRLKRFHICATYVLSFIALAWVRSQFFTGHAFWTEVAPITGPMYQLFTFFMITDPKTTVSSKKGQILVAFLVAFAECVLRLMNNIHAPYFALFTVGPIANLVDIWLQGKRAKASTPKPATA